MIFGHLAFDNIFAVVAGLVDIGLALALIKWRVEFTRATARVQRGLGPMGRRTAARSDPRWTLTVGMGFLAIGVLSVCLGLMLDLEQ